jgi:dipeptidyl-peptidase-4
MNFFTTVQSPTHSLRARRIFVSLLALTIGALAASRPARAQISPESDKLLHRLFASPDFEVKKFGPARWLDGGAFYTTVEPSESAKERGSKDIVRYETATSKREVLVSASKLIPPNAKSPLTIDDYAWSKDKSRALIFTNTAQVWRRNTRGDYWALDLKSGLLQKLGGDAPASSLLFAKFSPDGTRVAYVRANNIYVEELAGGHAVQLTRDGSATIINGTSDWVYEEELALRDCFRWSPDGRKLPTGNSTRAASESFRSSTISARRAKSSPAFPIRDSARTPR